MERLDFILVQEARPDVCHRKMSGGARAGGEVEVAQEEGALSEAVESEQNMERWEEKRGCQPHC